MKKITFILPMPARSPVGGYKIIYEYADRLAKKYQVEIIYAVKLPHIDYKYSCLVRLLAAYYIIHSKKYYWYKFKNKVKFRVVSEINNASVLEGDIIIATAWETVHPIFLLAKSKGDKYYFIQSYEIWNGDKTLVENTYKLGLKNIVVASWLKKKIELIDGNVHAHLPNGIDFDIFKMKSENQNRKNHSILMMYHPAELKGGKDGIKVLEKIKKIHDDISVTFFSVVPRNEKIPSWIKYIHKPSLNELVELYNANTIFISSSWLEGFGLPGAEATACGCALVTTDNGGCRDYAINHETALVSEPKNIENMVYNICMLLDDNLLRIKIANSGYNFIQKFSWENAIQGFEKEIIDGN